MEPPTWDPPAVYAGALAVLFGLALFPGPDAVSGPWRLAGLLPVLAGTALHGTAWTRLRRRSTTIRADEAPTTLVSDGPYARTRNPMYLAGVFILVGGAILLGAAWSFLLAPAWAWTVHRSFLPAEEAALEERFGEAYRAYRERVRPWL